MIGGLPNGAGLVHLGVGGLTWTSEDLHFNLFLSANLVDSDFG